MEKVDRFRKKGNMFGEIVGPTLASNGFEAGWFGVWDARIGVVYVAFFATSPTSPSSLTQGRGSLIVMQKYQP
jgi:hypothetical protein